jgi:hypothetical protein
MRKRFLVYGSLIGALAMAIAVSAIRSGGRFVRADSTTAFVWDTTEFLATRGQCYSAPSAFRVAEDWGFGRGRYILTMVEDGPRGRRVRGRLWLSDDVASTPATPVDARHPVIAGYGATDIDFSRVPLSMHPGPYHARSTNPLHPGVRIVRDTSRNLYTLLVLLRPDSVSGDTLRMEVHQGGGDGFAGRWRRAGTQPDSGYFCAGWIDV